MFKSMQKIRKIIVFTVITIPLSILYNTIAFGQTGLDNLAERYQTPLGSMVVVFENGSPVIYAYNGELTYDFMRIPEPKRAVAKTALAQRYKFDPDNIMRVLSLSPITIKPTIVHEPIKCNPESRAYQRCLERIRRRKERYSAFPKNQYIVNHRDLKFIDRSKVYTLKQASIIDSTAVSKLTLPPQAL